MFIHVGGGIRLYTDVPFTAGIIRISDYSAYLAAFIEFDQNATATVTAAPTSRPDLVRQQCVEMNRNLKRRSVIYRINQTRILAFA